MGFHPQIFRRSIAAVTSPEEDHHKPDVRGETACQVSTASPEWNHHWHRLGVCRQYVSRQWPTLCIACREGGFVAFAAVMYNTSLRTRRLQLQAAVAGSRLERLEMEAPMLIRPLTSAMALAAIIVASPAAAYRLDVSFSALPSTQGWQYSTSGAPESSVFSIVAGNTLVQNTIGIGAGGANYQLSNQLMAGQSISLSFTARILSEEGPPLDYGAISAGIGLGQEVFAIALRPGEIRDFENRLLSASVDTSIFHNYTLLITPSVDYKVLVDGVQIAVVAPSTGAQANYIYFGDGSRLNALGEYTVFSVSQVPEPKSGLLAGLGLLAVALRYRKS